MSTSLNLPFVDIESILNDLYVITISIYFFSYLQDTPKVTLEAWQKTLLGFGCVTMICSVIGLILFWTYSCRQNISNNGNNNNNNNTQETSFNTPPRQPRMGTRRPAGHPPPVPAPRQNRQPTPPPAGFPVDMPTGELWTAHSPVVTTPRQSPRLAART